jgi:hypothetical protein
MSWHRTVHYFRRNICKLLDSIVGTAVLNGILGVLGLSPGQAAHFSCVVTQ